MLQTKQWLPALGAKMQMQCVMGVDGAIEPKLFSTT